MHAIVFDAFSSRRNPHKLALMGAFEGEIIDDFVPFGDRVVYDTSQIWKSKNPLGKKFFYSLARWRKTWYFTVINKVGTKQFIDGS